MRILTRRRRIWSFLAVIAGGLAVPQGAQAQTMEDMLRDLIASHPAIRAAEERSNAAGQVIGEARAGFFPRVTASGDLGYGRADTPGRRALRLGELEGEQTSARLVATQPLFDGFRANSSVKSATARANSAIMESEATRQQVIFEGISAYLDVMERGRLLELSRFNENTIKRQLALEDERVARGSGIQLDSLFAKSRLQLAKERRTSIEGELADGKNRFRRAFQQEPSLEALIIPAIPVGALPDERDAAIEAALGGNQSLLSSKSEVLAAKEDRRQARADYFPQLDLEGSANFEEDVDGSEGIRREWKVELRARWKLFDGFLTPSRAARADALHNASIAQSSNIARQVAEFTGNSWDQLETARNRFRLLENAVAIAEEVFEARQKLRSAGKETAINVLDAESELFAARISAVRSEFEARRAAYRLLLAMGNLTPETLGM